MSEKSWEFFIAGMSHYEINKVMDELVIGNNLALVLEPSNVYDSSAIRIEYIPTVDEGDNVMLGYVPARISPAVTAAALTNRVYCEIVEVNPKEKFWGKCKVRITKEEDQND